MKALLYKFLHYAGNSIMCYKAGVTDNNHFIKRFVIYSLATVAISWGQLIQETSTRNMMGSYNNTESYQKKENLPLFYLVTN